MKANKFVVFITSVKHIDSLFVISGITNKGTMVVNSQKKFKPGDLVEFTGQIKESEGIKEMDSDESKLVDDRKSMDEINKYIDSNVKILKPEPFIPDSVTRKMSESFDEAARRVLRALFLRRPIIVRHHNDTDGVCSGLAINLAIGFAKNVRILSNKYPGYRFVEAQQDVDLTHQFDAEYLPPLLLISDLGSTIDSFGTYDYVKKFGFEIIVVDHHPPSPDLNEHVDLIVSPHISGGDSSYTAGLLASEISQRIAKTDLRDLPFIALVGDKSFLEFKKNPKYLRYGIALDYLVSMKDPSIDEIERNFLDKEAMEMNYMMAMERIETVKASLMRKVKKKQFSNVAVFTVNTDKEFENGHFPSRGMMANMISDEMAQEAKTPVISVGHGKRNINLRFNKPALVAGWNGAELISKLRGELPNAIESGGGHPGAASIRVNKGFAKILLEQLLWDLEEESKAKK